MKLTSCFLIKTSVPEIGLEPIRPCERQILSLLRTPIFTRLTTDLSPEFGAKVLEIDPITITILGSSQSLRTDSVHIELYLATVINQVYAKDYRPFDSYKHGIQQNMSRKGNC
jgi:hypothetical protein